MVCFVDNQGCLWTLQWKLKYLAESKIMFQIQSFFLPNKMQAIMTVKRGADDFIVSENDIATFFNATTDDTTDANLQKEQQV